MTIWDQGRGTIERMLDSNELQKVPASEEHAARLLNEARAHLESSVVTRQNDPEGAYAASYAGARKALESLLAIQGLRRTTRGGHIAVYEATMAQFDPPMGGTIRPFDRMRRRRGEAEYPEIGTPSISQEELVEDGTRCSAIIDMAITLVPKLPLF